jgi:peptidyl-prolyl cis-trans isomerase SurA
LQAPKQMKRLTVIQKAIDKKKHIVPGLLGICIFTTILLGGGVYAQEPEVIDRIVAVVNSDIITLYDLNRAFKPYEENIKALQYVPEKERQTLFQVRKDLLDQLIDSKLADQETERAQITVDERDIDRAIERMKEARSFTDEQLREGLARQGMTMAEYRKELKEQILRTRLVNREVKSKIVITSEDIKAYYESHQDEYAGEKKYYLYNIFVRLSPETDTLERQDALRQIKDASARLKQGLSFEDLVNQLEDSSSRVEGTDLGLYRLEELSGQLQGAVAKLKAGEISEVLDTDFGPQIIYVQKILETPTKSMAEIESEIGEKLYNEAVDNRYQDWLDELRKRSLIKIIS